MQNSFQFLNSITNNILPFFMIFTRIGTIFFTIPPFRNNSVPNSLKVFFSVIFAMVIFPIAGLEIDITAINYFEIFANIASEFLFGLIISFVITMIFAAMQLAGRLVDLNSGFGFQNLVDPITNEEVTITTKFYFILALTLFFTIGGHNLLIRAISESFNFMPLGNFSFNSQTLNILIREFGDIFIIGFKIAVPIMAALFLTEVSLAILSRAIPQIRVFIIGFPLKISVAFLILAMTLINTVPYLQSLFEGSFVRIDYIFKSLRG